METIKNILTNEPYPGRGIIIGFNRAKLNVYTAYFITGRSENSKNRKLELSEDKTEIKTKIVDEKKLNDPTNIIYSPLKILENHVIISNGNQTETIIKGLNKNISIEESLKSRTFEQDSPIYTPRISCLINLTPNKPSYILSIIKKGEENITKHFFYSYSDFTDGCGHLIYTYNSSKPGQIESFSKEPILVKIPANVDEFKNEIWQSLNENLKISMFFQEINIETKTFETKIINKSSERKN